MTTLRPWLLCALPLLAGCPNRPQASLPAPPPATITAFTVTPGVSSGTEPVVLEWGTTNATAISLEQVGVGPLDAGAQLSGRLAVNVEQSTVFVLSAQGAGGGDLKTASVVVGNRVRGALFTGLPAVIDANQPSTLVWNAPGASSVVIREVGGALLDLGLQNDSGSIQVRPTVTTTYELLAGARTFTTTITVNPTVTTLKATPAVAVFGQPLTISWETRAASTVTLTRAGAPAALLTGAAASGQFVDTTFPQVPPDGFLTYVIEVADAQGRTSRQALDVPVGGGVEISSLTVPRYAQARGQYTVAWTTRGGETAELIVDGHRQFVPPTRASVAAGSYVLPSPTQSSVITFVVRNSRGDEARETRTIEGVGPLAYNSFTADKYAIAAPGEAVTLTWSATNARNIRITSNTGTGFFRWFSGNVETGSLVVYPNSRASLTRIVYTLEADNGTGAAPPFRRTLEVVVGGAPATFRFPRRLPVGARSEITGSTLGTVTGALGFGRVTRNAPGDAFVDIRRTGTAVTFLGTDNAANFALPTPFEATVFGSRINATRLNVSKYGWFRPTTSSAVTAGSPENDATLGTALEALAIAPYWRNLNTANGQVHWQIDDSPMARRLIVQWSNVRSVDGPVDGRATFQAQLYSNGRVVFAYRELFKVPGGAAGVTNFSENNEVMVTDPIASGDTFNLFSPQAFPASLRVESAPYSAFGLIGNETIDLEATGMVFTSNQVVISELHPRPVANAVNGEWLELRGTVDAGLDLSNWEIDFGGASYTFPPGATLPAFGRIVLAQASDLGDPNDPDGGILLSSGTRVPRPAVDFIYPATLTMGRAAGFARLGIFGAEYFRLSYATGGREGAAVGFEDERFSWVTYDQPSTRLGCAALRPRYGSNGQYGSPGLPNQSCWAYDERVPVGTPFQPIASTGNRIIFTPPVQTFPADDEGLFVLNLQQPLMLFGQPTTTLTISTNGFVVPYALSPCVDPVEGPHACFINPTLPGVATSNKPTFAIAPFWTDLDGTRSGAGVYYRVESNGDVLISWENTSFFVGTLPITTNFNFQVLLSANGDVEFRYGAMSGSGSGAGVTGAQLARGLLTTSWIDMARAAERVNVFSATPGISPNTHFYFRMSMAR